VRVTRYVAGYVRWLFVFERRVRAAVDQDRARGAAPSYPVGSVFARRLRQRARRSRGDQAGAGGARAAGLADAFLFLGS